MQPGSLVDADGNPVQNAQVGISPVPASLVMDMLPAGLLQHTFDITIQAPGGATFTTPAQLTLPNVFGAAPGTKLDILELRSHHRPPGDRRHRHRLGRRPDRDLRSAARASPRRAGTA